MTGGHSAPVVRVGDSVHRVAGPWTPLVQRLMAGLRAAGVGVVPEPRGLDAEGREVVEYVAGDCPVYPLPAWVWSDDVVRQVGAALRAVHDASARLELPSVGWRDAPVEPGDVVCHGDVAPYNTVWRAGRLVAFIDWDHARPAPRGYDLGYAAYRFVSLTPPGHPDGHELPVGEQRRRLALLCDAYGDADPDDVLRWAAYRLDLLVANASPHAPLYAADARWLRSAYDLPG
ncbi:MAG TPA: phosphotransferase [Frankiaceae bacterium]|nr:phosphotransferase [Frankiaceae bacterium]